MSEEEAKAQRVAVLTPIYKTSLGANELAALKHSYAALHQRDIFFIGPPGLDTSWYVNHFTNIRYRSFDAVYFTSIKGYSDLLTSSAFYDAFPDYTHLLIVQHDCIVFRDDLDHWMDQGFDYIGAPWPNPWTFVFPALGSPFDGHSFQVTVGNGGLSLRRISACVGVLKEFEWLRRIYHEVVEDAFFALAGLASCNFRVPNAVHASRFSIECEPQRYLKLNGALPMGTHAWEKWNKPLWLEVFAQKGISGFM